MKINLLAEIKDYRDKTIEKSSIRDLIVTSLNSFAPDENPKAEEKNKCFSLSVKACSVGEVDLSIEDRVFIKKRAGKILMPMHYGRLCGVLDDPKK